MKYTLDQLVGKRFITEEIKNYLKECRIVEIAPSREYVKLSSSCIFYWQKTKHLLEDVVEILGD